MWNVALQLTKVYLLQILRDRKALFVLIAMPVVLTSILSFALGSMFGGQSLPKFPVSVYNGDTGPYGKRLVTFLQQQSNQFEIKLEPSLTAAKQDILTERTAVSVVIPNDYSKKVAANQTGVVRVDGLINNGTQLDVVKGYVNGQGVAGGAARYVAIQGAADHTHLQWSPIIVNIQSPGLRPLTAGAYYAIGMTVMFLLTNAMNRASALVRERGSDTFKRMVAAPSSRHAFVLGYFISNFVVLTLQGALNLIAARYILGIQFGPVVQMVLLLITYTMALAGISVWLGGFVSSIQTMSNVANIGAQFLSVLGGSFYPIYAFPKVMQMVGKLIPNGRVLESFLDSVTGVSLQGLVYPIMYLAILGILFGLISSVRPWSTAKEVFE